MALKIVVKPREIWDNRKQEFINTEGGVLVLEHSLVSISKWESKWHKPFISEADNFAKTEEEIIDYIKCMTINQNVDPYLYFCLDEGNLCSIRDYINDPMTATIINDNGKKGRKKIITSELIYYWMIALHIPIEFQKWHINRLMTLIQLCNIENENAAGNNKMTKNEALERTRRINQMRRNKK